MTTAFDCPFELVFDMSAVVSSVTVTPNDVTALVPGRLLAVACTVAGNVAVGFPDGSTFTVPVAIGLTHLPYAVAKLYATGTTATATYAVMR